MMFSLIVASVCLSGAILDGKNYITAINYGLALFNFGMFLAQLIGK